MPRTHGRVAKSNGIKQGVEAQNIGSFRLSAQIILSVFKGFDFDPLSIAEFLKDNVPHCVARHVHRDEGGRKNRAVLVTIEFFKNFTQNRRIYRRTRLADSINCFNTKIETPEKIEQIMKRQVLTRSAFLVVVNKVRAFEIRQFNNI